MKRLAKLLAAKDGIVAKMAAINDAADAQTDGKLTAEQEKDYAALEDQLADVKGQIKRQEALDAEERTERAVRTADDGGRVRDVRTRADQDPFRGFGQRQTDFLMAVLDNSDVKDRDSLSDERLKPLAVVDAEGKQKGRGPGFAFLLPLGYTPRGLKAAAGSDEHSVSDFGYGGALVQPTFIPQLYELGFEGDPTAGRTTPLPMSTLAVAIPARVDKNHTSSVTGGLTVGRRAEIEALSSSRGEMELINFRAHGFFGLSYATEEILEFSPISFVALLRAGFSAEFAAGLLKEKLLGTGGDEFVGVVNADCTVAVTRTTASTVKGADIVNMRSRCWGYGQAIWLANHDVFPKLFQSHVPLPSEATPTNIVAIYSPSLVPDRPDMLLGRPIFYTEFCQTLGTKGDLVLGNFSQFLEGTLTPLQSAESVHVRFLNHERTFKFWLMNTGAPWWRTALTPNKSTTTLSPFVTIAT